MRCNDYQCNFNEKFKMTNSKKDIQSLQDATSSIIAARGSAERIGKYELHLQAHLSNSAHATLDVISAPFQDLHKIHDLAKSAAIRQYRQQFQASGGSTPLTLKMGSHVWPNANMVLLQVLFFAFSPCLVSHSAVSACWPITRTEIKRFAALILHKDPGACACGGTASDV